MNWDGTADRHGPQRPPSIVKAAATNTVRPDAVAHLREWSLVSTMTIVATATSVLTAISEGTMSSSWNGDSGATRADAGVADLDPNNTLGESDRMDNVWPRGGR